MSLTHEELLKESRAKIFNAHWGSGANMLVPVLVLALTFYAGQWQREQDDERRATEQRIAQADRDAATKRECLGEVRETARMLTQTASNTAAYDTAVIAVTDSLNRICGPVGVTLPAPFLAALKSASQDLSVTQATRSAAAQVLREVVAIQTAVQPHVYLHIGAEDQRAAAEALGAKLATYQLLSGNISAPGVEKVAKLPKTSELRYVNAADAAEAQQLAGLLGRLGAPVVVKKIKGAAAPHSFEVWLQRTWSQP